MATYGGWLLPGVGLLLVTAFLVPGILEIWHAWSTQRYAAHGIFVPILAAVILWHRRQRFGPGSQRGSVEGVVVLAIALALTMLGVARGSVLAHTVSIALAAAGVALWLGGREWLKHAAAPCAFLLFMLPLPRDLGGAISLPVQHLVARGAAGLLDLVRIPAARNGLRLELPTMYLTVDESCNGLRFMMVLLVVTTAFALIHLPTTGRRGIVIATVIPTALLANVIRVAAIGVAVYVFGPQAATGFAHDYIGRAIWLLALAATLGFGVMLGRNERRAQVVTAG